MATNHTSYMAAESLAQARGLSSSISSLSASNTSGRNNAASHISKTYRQASTLFLTRRLPEALSTVLPLVSPPQSDDPNNESTEPAPVIRASRSSRVKVWSLYLTVLNAIAELDPEDGKDAFGGQDWRALCYKVRSGDIWEEVIRNGYHGVEADVDAEVVINLATLLLAHSKTQNLNQKRLENYLAAARTPSLDISADRFSESPARRHESPSPSPAASRKTRRPAPSGADTPRDLNARVKILELYTLHVLPRNDQWEYAHEFISVSPVLDDERREAFLQALDTLREEQAEAGRREEEERAAREEAIRRDIEEARRLRAENEAREKKRLEEERLKRDAEAREREREKEREKERLETAKAKAKAKATVDDFGVESNASSSSSTPAAPASPALKKGGSSGSQASGSGGMARSRGPLPRRGAGNAGGGGGSNAVAAPTLMSRASMVWSAHAAQPEEDP
ncbi:hypothetical protein CHGG_02929 [Chaetomium globosum CBS 148.51]|uniref:Uncharacterized protein n=1 Tax=Chaetomium globosum (strain ATCC 6205 / CBS 148.51 / DSM 1962 / NBRC 6347 / NRRL 1970) TaxID=306901 RepID=Q2HA25_CHAGB|nr:uncharacterized protein CHGG_02929 [Chaetomium globosum CBS 148.51]EAQ90994.1 hypothetical protein CHGG_02929 [Chaetomium globosum CBS 148.51]